MEDLKPKPQKTLYRLAFFDEVAEAPSSSSYFALQRVLVSFLVAISSVPMLSFAPSL